MSRPKAKARALSNDLDDIRSCSLLIGQSNVVFTPHACGASNRYQAIRQGIKSLLNGNMF
jgi:hypothetical protein